MSETGLAVLLEIEIFGALQKFFEKITSKLTGLRINRSPVFNGELLRCLENTTPKARSSFRHGNPETDPVVCVAQNRGEYGQIE